MKKKNIFKQLSKEERFVIEKLYTREVSIRYIASMLGRSPNTIASELKRNRVKGEYSALKAHQKSYMVRWRAKQ